jgi:hypothetical protein
MVFCNSKFIRVQLKVADLDFRNRNCWEGVRIFDEGGHESESRGVRKGVDGTVGSPHRLG